MKIVIADPKAKTSKQIELDEAKSAVLMGKKLGAKVSGGDVGLSTDYEFEITGGTDDAGFPMRSDISGPGRRKILAVQGVGLKPSRHGMRKRKTVHGNTVSDQTAQVNMKVSTYGAKPLFEEPKAEETAEDKE